MADLSLADLAGMTAPASAGGMSLAALGRKLGDFDWSSLDTVKGAKGIGQALYSGFTAPGDVMAGRLDPFSDEGRQRAMGTAMMMLGPSPASGMGSGVARAGAAREAADQLTLGQPPRELLPLYDQPAGLGMPSTWSRDYTGNLGAALKPAANENAGAAQFLDLTPDMRVPADVQKYRDAIIEQRLKKDARPSLRTIDPGTL